MTRPILGLAVGLLWAFYALLSYRGHPLLQPLPAFLQRAGSLAWLAGNLLLALAAAGGMAGELLHWNLRLVRIVLALLGMALLLVA